MVSRNLLKNLEKLKNLFEILLKNLLKMLHARMKAGIFAVIFP